MERKKLYNETALDELLTAVSEKNEDKIIDDEVFENDIPSFIIRYNIKSGDKLTHKLLLYRIYKKFSSHPLNQASFTKELSLYIRPQGCYYLINKEPSDLIADLSEAIKKKRTPLIRSRNTKLQFQKFLNTSKIDSGEEWVESHIISYFYDKWLYENKKKKKLKAADLIALMRIFFQSKKTKDGYVFKITHGFSKESIENLRAAWKRKKQKDQE